MSKPKGNPGANAEIKDIIYPHEPMPGQRHFGHSVQILIGEVGSSAGDSFDLMVMSPSWFAERYNPVNWAGGDPYYLEDEVLPGGHVLPITGVWLMPDWSREHFETAVKRLIPAFSPGPDWGTVASRIGRIVPWEYDYSFDRRANETAELPDTRKSFWHD